MLSFLLCTTAAIAQQSGRYTRNTDHVEFELAVQGQSATLTGWRFELTFQKNAEGIYVADGGKVRLENGDDSFIMKGDGMNDTPFSLYAPLSYTLPDGIKEHVVDGKVYFYAPVTSEPHIIGEYLYEGQGAPKALLKADGSGYFKDPASGAFEYWGVETNYKGEVQKSIGVTGNYILNIAVKHTDGTHRRMQVIVFPAEQETVLYSSWVYKW